MYQKDYILREIERIGDMLRFFNRRIIEQKDELEEAVFNSQLDEELFDQLNIKMDDFLVLSKENLHDLLKENSGLNNENVELLGDLLIRLSEITTEHKYKYMQQALALYKYIDAKSNTYNIGLVNKISGLEGIVEEN